MTDLEQLAELIFPDVTETIEDLEKDILKETYLKGQSLQDLRHHQQDSYTQEVYSQP